MLVNKTMSTVAQEDWRYFLDRTIWFPAENDTAEKVRHFYFGDEPFDNNASALVPTPNMDPLEKLGSYTNMISDRGFYFDTHHGVKIQSLHSPVYLYYYSYRSEWSVVRIES